MFLLSIIHSVNTIHLQHSVSSPSPQYVRPLLRPVSGALLSCRREQFYISLALGFSFLDHKFVFPAVQKDKIEHM